MTNITRGEWGFGGVYVTDWRYQATTGATFSAGCDLLMPYSHVDYIDYCVENEDPMDTVSVVQLQQNVCRMMNAILSTSSMSNYIETSADVQDEEILAGDTVDVTVSTKNDLSDIKLFDTNGRIVEAEAEKIGEGTWNVSFTAREAEKEILLVYTQEADGMYKNSGATICYKAEKADEAVAEEAAFTAEIQNESEIKAGDEVHLTVNAPSYAEYVKLSDGEKELETSVKRKVKHGKAIFDITFTAQESATIQILTASSEEIYEDSGITAELIVK